MNIEHTCCRASCCCGVMLAMELIMVEAKEEPAIIGWLATAATGDFDNVVWLLCAACWYLWAAAAFAMFGIGFWEVSLKLVYTSFSSFSWYSRRQTKPLRSLLCRLAQSRQWTKCFFSCSRMKSTPNTSISH